MINRAVNYGQLIEKTLKIINREEKKLSFWRIIESSDEGVEFFLYIDTFLSQTCHLSDQDLENRI